MTNVKSRLRRLLNVGGVGVNSTARESGKGNTGSVLWRHQEMKDNDTCDKSRLNFRILSSLIHSCDESTAENSSLASSVNSGTCPSDDDDEVIVLQSTTSDFFAYEGSDPFADVRARMEALRSKSLLPEEMMDSNEEHGRIPEVIAFFVYLSYAIMIMVGHIRDFFGNLTGRGRFVLQAETKSGLTTNDSNASFFAPLLKNWENFYKRRLYMRLQDAFNRPISSNPGSYIQILERVSEDNRKSMSLLGSLQEHEELNQKYKTSPYFEKSPNGCVARKCVNLGSYNYLGFADDWQSTCAESVKASLNDLPVSTSSSHSEFGTTVLHRDLEQTVAKFLGKEDAIVFTMGFNTNATTIPALISKGDLIISDELNHTSIVNGARSSGAAIRTFKHNDPKHLEQILRESVLYGKPRTRRPWNKILVIVEGIYSMEGEFCNLKPIVEVSKQYGAYVYLDEAHSIGATGITGRGCTEFAGVAAADIDIMMGTFTKSFGGMGGYIAADKTVISMLRSKCYGFSLHNSLSPTVCQQVLTSFKVIMGEDGTDLGKRKIQALRDNSNYFRMRLLDMGLQVLGQYDSPIMPVMLYHPAKIAAFSRECLKRGLAVVVVGFPAVPILMSRARICMSACLTRQDLDFALDKINEVADLIQIKYKSPGRDSVWTEQ